MKKRHAYLVMAHNDFESLRYLLRAIDDERNDIYLHIDKKTKNVPFQELAACVKKSQLHIVPRIKVYWGHVSIVDCELRLLKAAISNEHYHYYHLISGNDFPLKSQDEIHRILENDNSEHIDCFNENDAENTFIYKVKYYFPFFRWTSKGVNTRFRWLNYFVAWLGNKEWKSMKLQKRLGIDRTKNMEMISSIRAINGFLSPTLLPDIL
ncbi:beta-1,6-N-acetylglucosaminyltransferase [Pseudobutyrivibrio sp. UC1225]|uniref:beta-1,6-N-acetylglucosaminyltransferase n=1 Tax=Pseudobutyrivibrio sp. UC1225 TaxID=1798185 RepID=UPI000B1051A5|nr:beta-1,6-N-acetylglucosaminyltransferase [Pseudobutyrivibrio sp. UC1225]